MSGSRKSPPGSRQRTAGLGAVLAAVTLPFTLQAGAQDAELDNGGLGEIIVTAQHREENLQQVPISVTALTADSLENIGVSATSAITQAVPAVQFTRSGPVGMFFVRGVGTSNGAAGDEGSNAFYVDGVYMPDQFQTIMNFNNIERIEVLKGPQGTLFGRNAYGGLVHLITRDPSDGTSLNAKAGYGKYETVNGQFYAGGPVSDTLAMDIALTGQDQGKGWGDNFTRHEETKKEKYWGARSKAVFTPSEDLKFTLAGDTYELKDNTALAWRIADGFVGSGGNLSPGGQDTTANDAALTSLRTWGLGLTVEADLGFATLTSISAARQNDQHSFFDTDGGPLPLIRMDYNSGTRSLQQELRLASNETDPLSWQAGMFWLRSRIYADALIQGMGFWSPSLPGGIGNLNAGQHLPAELNTDTWAAFGEVTYSFTEKTHLTAGYRYTEDTRSFDAAQEWVVITLPTTPVSDTLRYDEGTYRIALRHDLTDDVNVYASWNRGFKAGTFNMQSPLVPAVQPMSIDAYEVGVKSELFDRRVRFNVALFHYDMDDYQIRAASGATGSSFLLNAAKVETDGIDVEFEWAAMDNLSVYGGFTMLDAEYDSFPRAPFNYPHSVASLPAGATCPPTTVFPTPQTSGLLTTCSGNAKGNETAMSPDFTGTIGATYTMPLANSREVRLSALYNYNSGYYFEPDLTTGQSQYHVFNASVEYVLDDNWSVALWGKNLTDDEYLAQVSSTGTGPFATLAPPRTYGVSVEYNY